MSLQISESSLNFSEDLSEISEIFSSSDKMPGNSPRTIFTRGVPPARATVSKPYTARGRLPESERGDVVIDINETMRGVPSNSEAFNSPTPVRVYPNESGSSIAIDWAYLDVQKTQKHRKLSLSSESTNSSLRRPSRITIHENTPPEPELVRTRTRNHVDFVLRPSIQQHTTFGQTYRRGTNESRFRREPQSPTQDAV